MPTELETLSAAKKTARAAAAEARDIAFAQPDRAARVAAANDHLRAFLQDRLGAALEGCVLSGYAPMRSEIDPMPTLTAHPGPVCLPVIAGKAQPLRFRAWREGAELVPGPFGASVPATGDWLTPRALIVPLLAFDHAGYRLGYGGGFYDRTLAGLRAAGPVLAVGFASAAQRVDAVPVDATDERLDAVVTEDGVAYGG